MQHISIRGFFALVLFPAVFLTACHKEEQAVVGVAQNAVNAEHQAQTTAQAVAAERDHQRAALILIPLPTKSMYVNVHEAAAWANPFLTVDAASLTLRTTLADAGHASPTHPVAARTKQIQVLPEDLAKELVALPASAWLYGRVIAVAEAPQASPKDRPKVRRNIEAAIQQLNDMGIVVEEWPTR